MNRRYLTLLPAMAGSFLVVLAGCTPSPPPPAPTAPAVEEHGHKPGSHGGIIVPIGRDNYHAEAVFEKGGVFRLYILGKDESRVQVIERQTLQAFARPAGGGEARPFSLEPTPTADDPDGMTSQFAGTLPTELAGTAVTVTIPSVRVGGERFRLADIASPAGHFEEPARQLSDAEERQLYLTPGGKYTAQDIQANGATTPSAKFRGIKSTHNTRTAPGDRICPISQTKANPKFAWIIDGKKYEFCCPPCIDEFVKQAKEQPDSIQEPDFYFKK